MIGRPRLLLAGALVVTGALGNACANGRTPDGPLVGPRAAPGGVEICTPLGGASVAYMGTPLENSSRAPVVIKSARIIEKSNIDPGHSQVLVDLAGPEAGDVVGNFVLPGEDPVEQRQSQARLDRALRPKDVVVDPGVTANLLVGIAPKDISAASTVRKVVVDYLAGSKEYEETISVTYKVVAKSC